LAVDKPRLKGYEHMQKNIKTAPGCNLTFRKNCLDKWVHLTQPRIHSDPEDLIHDEIGVRKGADLAVRHIPAPFPRPTLEEEGLRAEE